MAFSDLFAPQAKEVGPTDAIKQWSQQSRLNWPQQLAQGAMLAQGVRNLFQPQPSFEPIRNEYMRAYRENTLPGLLSNFTGNMNGGDMQRAVAQGDIDLATRLAGLQANFQQHQADKGREFATNLLNIGTKPSQENVYAPMPFDAARQYLEQQGTTNPSLQQIQEVMPMFQTQPNVFEAAGNKIGTTVEDLRKSYASGGLPEVKNQLQKYWQQVTTGKAPELRGPGVTTSKQQFFAQHPDTAARTENNLTNAIPAQKSDADWVISRKRAHMPILDQPLQPGDYTFLRSIMENQSPAINRLAYMLDSRKAIDEFNKVFATNNMEKIKRYLKKKYGIVE